MYIGTIQTRSLRTHYKTIAPPATAAATPTINAPVQDPTLSAAPVEIGPDGPDVDPDPDPGAVGVCDPLGNVPFPPLPLPLPLGLPPGPPGTEVDPPGAPVPTPDPDPDPDPEPEPDPDGDPLPPPGAPVPDTSAVPVTVAVAVAVTEPVFVAFPLTVTGPGTKLLDALSGMQLAVKGA